MQIFYNFFNKIIFIIFLIFISTGRELYSFQLHSEKNADTVRVESGDEALLHWNFQNIDKVKVQGFNKTFSRNDSLSVIATDTITYIINAYLGKKDSLQYRVFVDIIHKDTTFEGRLSGDVQRGPLMLRKKEFGLSQFPSKYFCGISKIEESEPTVLKVMRTIYPYKDSTQYLIRAILLDSNGNYISGMENNKDSLKILSELNYNSDKIYYSIVKFNEVNNSDQNTDIAFLLDNSSAADKNSDILRYIKEFASTLSYSDNSMISIFNQDCSHDSELSPPDKTIWRLESNPPPLCNGLNAMYRASYNALNKLKASSNPNKLLILMTYISDNSSVIYTFEDITKLAEEFSIPIYIIGVGNSYSSYLIKYMTDITGGRFYPVWNADYFDIPKIFDEIMFSTKHYYEFSVPVSSIIDNATETKSNLKIQFKNNKFQESVNLIFKPSKTFTQYQSVATFREKDSILPEQFFPLLKSLANVLIDNPDQVIELTGNSDIEGQKEFNNIISLGRSEAVRNKLLEFGASPDQIKTRALGSQKRLFYFEEFDWQKQFNRRVDIRWLDPSNLPYEIIIETLASEKKASESALQWEIRGYRSYYERYLENDLPVYKVKIWGFQTLDEATKTAMKLEKQYKLTLYIE
jgi:outer membrane protein OmpA-like peptidoglycan-associated protein